MKKEFGLYIHIPFCRQKCFYCDFPSFAGREKKIDKYLQALEQEFALLRQGRQQKDGAGDCERNNFHRGNEGKASDGFQREEYIWLNKDSKFVPRTIYIGGGTPTVLNLDQMGKLLDIVQKYVAVSEAEEFTVEMNPGTVDREKLLLLQQAGVNRLSVGVQSFDDHCLQKIGRIHTAQEAVDTIELAHNLGFGNISLDLIYGLPQQDMEILTKSVERALTLPVQHISIYGLQLEEGTAFHRMEALGKLQLPTDELVEAMHDYIVKKLPEAGYQRYEISNYALPGYESKHNLSYWQDVDYLGLGSGAHSYWQGTRYENPRSIDDYISALEVGRLPAIVEEQVDRQAHMEEFCFLGLRTAAGIDKNIFQQKFGVDLFTVYGRTIEKLVAQDLLQHTGKGIALTPLGMKYGNQVFAEFLL